MNRSEGVTSATVPQRSAHLRRSGAAICHLQGQHIRLLIIDWRRAYVETACLTTVSPHSLRDHKKYLFWLLPLAECIGRGSSCARFLALRRTFLAQPAQRP